MESLASSRVGCACNAKARATACSRRTFLGLATGAAGLLLLPARAWGKKLAVALDKLPMLRHVGGWTIAKLKGVEMLLIRASERNVTAVSPSCTHEQTRLTYQASTRRIHCPRHGSQFDLKGAVLKGPATARLTPVYPATLDASKQRVIIELP